MNLVDCSGKRAVHVYPDTSAWNCLCDQNVDPRALVARLAENGATLTLGFNVFYEMAKLFHHGSEVNKVRGRVLMTYMKHFLALRVPIVKENRALLIEEALDVTRESPMQSFFRNDGEYQRAVTAVEELIEHGTFEPEAERFFDGRKALVRESRDLIRCQLESHPDLRKYLEGIPEDGLHSFLEREASALMGEEALSSHLAREFPKNSAPEVRYVASLLLLNQEYRVARALSRSDLYLYWRCAKRGSIRSDLPDDTYHVVSAAYGNMFVTTEPDQANIARLIVGGIRAVVSSPTETILDRIQRELQISASASA